jgi:HlyD family secretion protein
VANRRDGEALRQLRTLLAEGTIGGLTDGQLLERFATGRGEAAERAFAALVERHGPIVLRLCRAVLRDEHEAQDAFQATFLVLARKARSLWVRDSLGPWLHQVAYRAARCARSAAARRRAHERRSAEMATARGAEPGDREDLAGLLHEEVERLPPRYRVPLVLCDLEGCTHEQAARHLGCPVGTVKSRLSRGRELLRSRLARRGLAVPAGVLGASAVAEAGAVPPALVEATARAAAGLAAGGAPVAGTVPEGVARLVEQVNGSLLMGKLKLVAASVACAGFLAGGVGVMARQGQVGDRAAPAAASPPAPKAGPAPAAGDGAPADAVQVSSQVEGQTTVIAILPAGTRVKKGDVIAELDSAALREQLVDQEIVARQAEANLVNAQKTREVAEIAMDEFLKGEFPRMMREVEGEIVVAKAKVALATDRLDRAKRDSKDRPEAHALAELELTEARVAQEKALERQRVLRNFTFRRRSVELEAEAQKARADELSKQATWRREQQKVANLRRQIERCSIRAPIAGKLLHADGPPRGPAIEEGATVRLRQPLFRIVPAEPATPKE